MLLTLLQHTMSGKEANLFANLVNLTGTKFFYQTGEGTEGRLDTIRTKLFFATSIEKNIESFKKLIKLGGFNVK